MKGYRKASRYLKKKGLERRELNPRVLGTRLLNVSKPINSDLRNYFHPIPIRYSSRLISKLARQRDRGKLFHDISYKLSSFLSVLKILRDRKCAWNRRGERAERRARSSIFKNEQRAVSAWIIWRGGKRAQNEISVFSISTHRLVSRRGSFVPLWSSPCFFSSFFRVVSQEWRQFRVSHEMEKVGT